MRILVKNYIYNLLHSIIVLIVPVITQPYLARVLGANQLGIYNYINSAASIICTFAMLGTNTYGNRSCAYVRDNRLELSQVFCDIMSTRVMLGFVGGVVYFVTGILSGYTSYFLLYFIYYIGFVLDTSWLFVGVEDMKVCSLKNMFAKLLSVLGIFVFVKSQSDLNKYIILLGTATLIANLSVVPQLRKYITLKKVCYFNIPKHIKSAFALCLPSLVSTIYLQMDKLMIRWLYGSTSEIAYYDNAEKIIMIPLSFITVIGTVMMPRLANEFAKGEKDKIDDLINKSLAVSLLMACPLMFGLAGISLDFIPWYLGEDFIKTGYAIIVLSPYILTNTLLNISGVQYFVATNQVKVLLISNICGMVINICTNALLIPNYGYIGAAIATVISQITITLIHYFKLTKQVNIKASIWQSWRYLIYSLLMFVVVAIIGYNMPATPGTTVIQICAGMFMYVFILVVLKDKQLFQFVHLLKQKRKG